MITRDVLALVLGYGTVLAVLLVVAAVVFALAKRFSKKARTEETLPDVPVEVPEVPAPLAPGSAGELMLHDVPPKTAALLMAIVADKMGKPLNELRFISIKEVK